MNPTSQSRPCPPPGGSVRPALTRLARRRWAAVALLGLFLGGFASSTLVEVLSSHPEVAHRAQLEDWPCHDSDDDPCGPDCACLCCPSRSPTVILPFRGAGLAQTTSSELETSVLPSLHPQEIDQRIFHPPRA